MTPWPPQGGGTSHVNGEERDESSPPHLDGEESFTPPGSCRPGRRRRNRPAFADHPSSRENLAWYGGTTFVWLLLPLSRSRQRSQNGTIGGSGI